jgi:hypothetical protein
MPRRACHEVQRRLAVVDRGDCSRSLRPAKQAHSTNSAPSSGTRSRFEPTETVRLRFATELCSSNWHRNTFNQLSSRPHSFLGRRRRCGSWSRTRENMPHRGPRIHPVRERRARERGMPRLPPGKVKEHDIFFHAPRTLHEDLEPSIVLPKDRVPPDGLLDGVNLRAIDAAGAPRLSGGSFMVQTFGRLGRRTPSRE